MFGIGAADFASAIQSHPSLEDIRCVIRFVTETLNAVLDDLEMPPVLTCACASFYVSLGREASDMKTKSPGRTPGALGASLPPKPLHTKALARLPGMNVSLQLGTCD